MRGGTRRWRAGLAAVVLLGALAACSGDGGSNDDPSDGPASRPANEGIDGVLAIRIESAKHTMGNVDYDLHPPAGGDHNPSSARCGFYTDPIRDEYLVHNIEHGSVWLAYSPALAPADVAVLREVVADNPDTIAAPYSDLDEGVAVVVTAWARQLTLTSVSDPRLVKFIKEYRNGDQAPEASIACPQIPNDAGSG